MSSFDLESHLAGIVLGVRFRPNFAIEDKFGKIADTILYDKKSFFNQQVFPTVSAGHTEKVLFNQDTDDSLKITNEDLILEINFPAYFKASDLNDVVNNYKSQCIKGILQELGIKSILRIGYIKRYIIQSPDLAKTFVRKTIGESWEGVDDINLRFSKKMSVADGVIKAGVHDHQNAIFNIIKKSNQQEIFVAVDFQHYYNPPLDSAADMKYDSFLKDAQNFTQNKCRPWLENNYSHSLK